ENAPLTIAAAKAITREILKGSPDQDLALCRQLIAAASKAPTTPKAAPPSCRSASRCSPGASAARTPHRPKGAGMQSWWMQLTDSESRLELRDVPLPEPGIGQLLVRLRAAALNRGEFVAGHGLHGKPGSWKAIGGEGAGEVVAIGPQADSFEVGDAVMGRCAGAFSEYALMDAAEAMAKPASLSW